MADNDLPFPLGLRFWGPLVVFCNGTKTMAPTPIYAPRFKKEKSYTSTPFLGLHLLFQDEFYLYFYKNYGVILTRL
jgi:hypothetical protein